MSDTTKIEWTKHTGGPWLACTEVSPGCAHCYSRELTINRMGPIIRKAYKAAGFEDWETRPVWGKTAPRVLTKSFWTDAHRWNARAAKKGVRESVFPSLIDWLDDMPAGIIDQDGNWLDKDAVLGNFLFVIHATPHLDWLLLTKRPENFHERLQKAWKSLYNEGHMDAAIMVDAWALAEGTHKKPPENVWIGTSVENQEQADKRIPELLKIPAKVRFLSAEPLLGAIDFRFMEQDEEGDRPHLTNEGTMIDWIIFGGESNGRECNVEWIRYGLRQCRAAGVKAFVKQLGSRSYHYGTTVPGEHWPHGIKLIASVINGKTAFVQMLKHPKGGDPAEWPEDLRVREFPE